MKKRLIKYTTIKKDVFDNFKVGSYYLTYNGLICIFLKKHSSSYTFLVVYDTANSFIKLPRIIVNGNGAPSCSEILPDLSNVYYIQKSLSDYIEVGKFYGANEHPSVCIFLCASISTELQFILIAGNDENFIKRGNYYSWSSTPANFYLMEYKLENLQFDEQT